MAKNLPLFGIRTSKTVSRNNRPPRNRFVYNPEKDFVLSADWAGAREYNGIGGDDTRVLHVYSMIAGQGSVDHFPNLAQAYSRNRLFAVSNKPTALRVSGAKIHGHDVSVLHHEGGTTPTNQYFYLSLDGTTYNNADEYHPPGGANPNGITYFAWVYIGGGDTTRINIAGKSDFNTTVTTHLYAETGANSDYKLRNATDRWNFYVESGNLNFGQWYRVAWSTQNDRTVTIWIDGQQIASSIVGTAHSANTQPLYFGGDTSAFGREGDVRMLDYRAYNGVASDEAVRLDYEQAWSGYEDYGLTSYFIPDTAGGDTSINATSDSLTLTEYAASVNAATNIAATVDNLTVTEYAASINAGMNISATVDSLTLTEYAASINAATTIQATVDNLTVTEYTATVQAGNNTTINATNDALVLTEYAANVNAATNISASVDALTLTEYQASITAGTTIAASVDNLTLTTYQATVALENTYINADVATLTLNEYPASITYTGETQTYTGGFNVYSRIQTEKEKRKKRIEMGIIEDLPEPQQEAVKKAAQTENKAVARAVLNQEVERLQGDMEALDAEIQAELLRQRTDELIDAYQAEMRDILKEIEAEQAELFVFNQRNQNAVAVLMMMN